MMGSHYLPVSALTSIWLALSIPLLGSTSAFGLDYNKLKAQMDGKRSSWQAQPSPFTIAERNYKIVAGAAEEDELTTIPLLKELENGTSTSPTLPSRFDWRDRNGLNYMPSAPDQGSCSSCVSFAAMGALEAQLNIVCDTPDRDFKMSRQFFFSCGGGSCKSGWKLSAAMTFLRDAGVPDAQCMPYTSADGQDTACSIACADHKERSVKSISTTQVTTGFIDRDAIKRALLRGPLVSNMILYEDLEFYKDGVYRHTEGIKLGSHAVVLTGWDNSDQSWIAMNSWGLEWGQNGFFKVAWDDISLPGRYTWLLDVARPLDAGICNYPR